MGEFDVRTPEIAVLKFIIRQWIGDKFVCTKIVLLIIAATITEVILPYLVGYAVDSFAQGERRGGHLLVIFIAMAALGMLMLACRHSALRSMVALSVRSMKGLVAQGFLRVQSLSLEWHAGTSPGSIVRQVTRGMWAMDNVNDVLLLALFPSAVVLAGAVVLLSTLSPLLGLAMLLGSVIYVSMTIALALRLIAPVARLSNLWDSRLSGAMVDAIGANLTVRSFGAESHEEERLATLLEKWGRRTSHTWVLTNWAGTMQGSILLVTRIALLGGVFWLWWRGEATTGDVVLVVAIHLVVNGYLRDVGQHLYILQKSLSELEELIKILSCPDQIKDKPNSEQLSVTGGEIVFDKVCFRFRGQQDYLFKNLSLRIAAGQRVGIVGYSGSGKSTFTKLLLRLYEPEAGRILIDGHDIASVAQRNLRQQIATVPQETILFNRTISDNIGYARRAARVSAIKQAALNASADDFITRLPRAYATSVGERGGKLSGGERQRVAIARAFLADPPIMIFDEATSNLDAVSERLVRNAIDQLIVGKTAIVVAHNLHSVQSLDRILVFDKGTIVEDGTHEELLALPHGIYRRLFRLQASSAET